MRMRSLLLLSPMVRYVKSRACRLGCDSIHHLLACNGTQSKGATGQRQGGVPAELPPPPAGVSSLAGTATFRCKLPTVSARTLGAS